MTRPAIVRAGGAAAAEAAADHAKAESPSEIEALEVRLVLEAIHARYGYDLRGYAPATIRRRLRESLAGAGLAHMGELQHRIITDPAFFAGVLDGLTVRVSEMFRDPGFYVALRDWMAPILRTYARLNVWLSGCAAGEEVYSAAILLEEIGLYDRCQIYATDISALAIEQAKRGLYPATSLPLYAANYERFGGVRRLDAYYAPEADGRIAMHERLRRNVVFFQHDLVSDQVFAEMHVIFCRNVLIYFGPELRDRVMQRFSESLCPGGFLCLGSSERLPRAAERLFAEFVGAERIYRQVPSS